MTSSAPRSSFAAGAATSAHQRRVRRLLGLGSGLTTAVALGWGVFFSLRGNWFVVGIDLVTIVLAAIIWQLTQRGRVRVAAYLLVATVYAVLCLNSLVFDMPVSDIPRSSHTFMLALGLVAALLMREEPAWLRHGVPLVCLATYAVLGSSSAGWMTAYALPQDVRASGLWINHVAAMVAVYLVLHVIQNDAAERSRLEGELRDALVRWQHPQRGMVSPAEFVPLAERTGLMLPLGDWVLKTACLQLAAWQRRPETAALAVAVNVSAVQFAQADFVAKVLGCVAKTGIDPAGLKLELTESMLAHDVEDIIEKMTALKARGIGFSLDDFGTGYSSLSYLRRLPLDQLKIDQSFVAGMLGSPKEAAIVQALVSLGRNLGIQLIAEGVETAEQWRVLQDSGCNIFQGYLFSRPVSAGAFEALLATPDQAARAIESLA